MHIDNISRLTAEMCVRRGFAMCSSRFCDVFVAVLRCVRRGFAMLPAAGELQFSAAMLSGDCFFI